MPERSTLPADPPQSPSEQLAALRRELENLRRERDDLRASLDQVAQVIGAPSADKIVHDVRNVVNELVLLRNLADLE